MRPEVLAPAGDLECLRAAVRAGADAVYFGVQGFNARARAANFTLDALPDVMRELHAWGVQGFVTLNTLVFDHELADLEQVVRACAAAGVDAVIVQDLGVVQLVRAVAPELAVHASTQMTCTDADSVRAAAARGATRVVLARELSLEDITAIRAALGDDPVELEVFVHGALCVSYSGQCLTSEAIGGRSANRGACAQACRLPYDLVVDGVVKDLGDVAHLLSPEDLEAAWLVPQLAAAGVACLKIEGRLKGPAYVAAATRLYRAAVDGLEDAVIEQRRADALVTYSRGSGPGFLSGLDHQRLVGGETCEHVGVQIGVVSDVVTARDRAMIVVALDPGVDGPARGQGLFVQGKRAGAGELGGRVWDVSLDGHPDANGGCRASIWLGPEVRASRALIGRRVFKNDDPALEKRLIAETERQPACEHIDVVASGAVGEPLRLTATSARGLRAVVQTDAPLQAARTEPLTVHALRDKLERLGETPYVLRALTSQVASDATLPISSLNRARRALSDALQENGVFAHATTAVSAADLLAATSAPLRPPPPAGLFVLCRTLQQAEAAVAAGADGVWLDFLALTGTQQAVHALRGQGARFIGAALPRIEKPGEEKIARFLMGLPLDGVLVRGLGALRDDAPGLRVADFSLNVTNLLTARDVLAHVDALVPSYDLDARQLMALLASGEGAVAARTELVVHHPMPLFHMEHCVFAALLSDGKDHKSCGRPCEHHQISLRDRVGMDLPVEADVGCRNTVFHARPQSAAASVKGAQLAGVRRFRIELVREGAAEVSSLISRYRALLDGTLTSKELFKQLRASDAIGVVQGTLRVLNNAADTPEHA